MATNAETADRRVVPRLRTFKEALATNELSGFTEFRFESDCGSEFLRKREMAWSGGNDLCLAIDLVAASVVLGKTKAAASAAEFVLASGNLASFPAQRLAQKLLGIDNDVVPSEPSLSRSQIFARVAALKAARVSQMRNCFIWMDLARVYLLLGQVRSAKEAFRVAHALAPSDRFIVRSGSRLLLHSGDEDEALHLLRRCPRTADDPWLMAAEIAVAAVCKKTPRFAKLGRQFLKDSDSAAFHKSELSSAVGSLELVNGNSREANKLFEASLVEPTDNSLAQVVWESKRSGLGQVSRKLFDAPRTAEAKALDAFNLQAWSDLVVHADVWAKDEAFSARPRVMASAIASSLLGEYELAAEIANAGLLSNPGHPGLINNVAFAYANCGKSKEAVQIIEHVELESLKPVDASCLLATLGLAQFRLGNVSDGERYYADSIEAARRNGLHSVRIAASLYMYRELVRIGKDGAFEMFAALANEAGKLLHSSVPAVARKLSDEVRIMLLDRRARMV